MAELTIRYIHMGAAGLSLALFMLRAWWSVLGSERGSARLRRRWVRVVPHLIDSVLLAAGITLMARLQVWPQQHPWLAAKLFALLAYIGVGTLAIKRGRTPRTRALAAILAVAIFVYIVGAASTHHPLSWLAA